MNRLQRRIRASVLKRVLTDPDSWIFSVDSTANIKRTAGILGGGLWANSKNEIFYGQNMMMLCAINIKTGESIPVYWLPWLKENEREKGKTNHDLVLTLVDAVIAEGWPKLTVVMDSWFDCHRLMKLLNERGITFSVELKSFRKPSKNPSPRSQKLCLVDIFKNLLRESIRLTTRENKQPQKLGWKNLKFISGSILWIGGKEKNSNKIRLKVTAVYNHPRENKAFAYYATNDLSKPYTWSWKMSRHRWNIEVGFKDLRQGFNWGKLAAKSQEGANLAWTLPILILSYMREFDSKTPILTQIERIKNEELMATIDFHANNPNHIQRKNLKIRILGTDACKKVRITSAEKPNSCKKSNLCNKIAA